MTTISPARAARAATACAHCGLAVPAALLEADDRPSFCCGGCATAYAIIHDGGLDRYYQLPERRAAPVEPSGRSFAEFDHPAFHALYVRRAPGRPRRDRVVPRRRALRLVRLAGGARAAARARRDARGARDRPRAGAPGVGSRDDAAQRHRQVPRHAGLSPASVPRPARRSAAPRRGPQRAAADRRGRRPGRQRDDGGGGALQRLVRRDGAGLHAVLPLDQPGADRAGAPLARSRLLPGRRGLVPHPPAPHGPPDRHRARRGVHPRRREHHHRQRPDLLRRRRHAGVPAPGRPVPPATCPAGRRRQREPAARADAVGGPRPRGGRRSARSPPRRCCRR